MGWLPSGNGWFKCAKAPVVLLLCLSPAMLALMAIRLRLLVRLGVCSWVCSGSAELERESERSRGLAGAAGQDATCTYKHD